MSAGVRKQLISACQWYSGAHANTGVRRHEPLYSALSCMVGACVEGICGVAPVVFCTSISVLLLRGIMLATELSLAMLETCHLHTLVRCRVETMLTRMRCALVVQDEHAFPRQRGQAHTSVCIQARSRNAAWSPSQGNSHAPGTDTQHHRYRHRQAQGTRRTALKRVHEQCCIATALQHEDRLTHGHSLLRQCKPHPTTASAPRDGERHGQ